MASLAGTTLAGRFCAWRGASGRRYVATVHLVDPTRDAHGLPDYEAFVVIAVGRDATGRNPGGRRILDVAPVERGSDRRAAVARGLARGAVEWHIHLLGEDRSARAAAIDDLRAGHVGIAAGLTRCA